METEKQAGDAVEAPRAAAGAGLDPKGVVAFVAALVAPGLGHLMLKRWKRGAVLAVVLLAIFVAGLLLHGRLYVPERSNFLSVIFFFADTGLLAPYLVCFLGKVGFLVQAKAPTYEYGTNMLAVAGLLNYLVALDAYDIAVGRKH